MFIILFVRVNSSGNLGLELTSLALVLFSVVLDLSLALIRELLSLLDDGLLVAHTAKFCNHLPSLTGAGREFGNCFRQQRDVFGRPFFVSDDDDLLLLLLSSFLGNDGGSLGFGHLVLLEPGFEGRDLAGLIKVSVGIDLVELVGAFSAQLFGVEPRALLGLNPESIVVAASKCCGTGILEELKALLVGNLELLPGFSFVGDGLLGSSFGGFLLVLDLLERSVLVSFGCILLGVVLLLLSQLFGLFLGSLFSDSGIVVVGSLDEGDDSLALKLDVLGI